jgi:hypothetical protein
MNASACDLSIPERKPDGVAVDFMTNVAETNPVGVMTFVNLNVETQVNGSFYHIGYKELSMGKVVLLTGAPGVGKSTLRSALSCRVPGLQAFDYGKLLLSVRRLKASRSSIRSFARYELRILQLHRGCGRYPQ